jgi:hypothetical protein
MAERNHEFMVPARDPLRAFPKDDALPPEQQQGLMLFLAARLRAQSTRMPESPKASREQTASWITEGEADMPRLWSFGPKAT